MIFLSPRCHAWCCRFNQCSLYSRFRRRCRMAWGFRAPLLVKDTAERVRWRYFFDGKKKRLEIKNSEYEKDMWTSEPEKKTSPILHKSSNFANVRTRSHTNIYLRWHPNCMVFYVFLGFLDRLIGSFLQQELCGTWPATKFIQRLSSIFPPGFVLFCFETKLIVEINCHWFVCVFFFNQCIFFLTTCFSLKTTWLHTHSDGSRKKDIVRFHPSVNIMTSWLVGRK